MALEKKCIFGAGLKLARPVYLSYGTEYGKSLSGTSSRESGAFGIPSIGVVSFSYTTIIGLSIGRIGFRLAAATRRTMPQLPNLD